MVEKANVPWLAKPFFMQVLSAAIDHAFVKLGLTGARKKCLLEDIMFYSQLSHIYIIIYKHRYIHIINMICYVPLCEQDE